MKNKTIKINLLGFKCPLPVLKTAKKLKEIKEYQELEVLIDDSSSEKDFIELCKRSSFKIIKKREENKNIFFTFKKI